MKTKLLGMRKIKTETHEVITEKTCIRCIVSMVLSCLDVSKTTKINSGNVKSAKINEISIFLLFKRLH